MALARTLIVVVFAFSLLSCNRQSPPTAANPTDWNKYVEQFIEDWFRSHPDTAVNAGRHEFDGKLPDWSAEGIRKEIARLKQERARASGFADNALDARQRLERDYVISVIDGELFWMENAEWPFKNPQYYGGSIDPNVYATREYAPLDVRLRAYTTYARAIPLATQQIRANLRTPLPRTYVRIGRITFGGLASYFEKDIPAIFASVKDEQLQRDFRAANQEAINAMKELDAWFASQEATATENFAIGADKFSEMLRMTEGVQIDLGELERIGRADLERNLAGLREACAKYAPGKSAQECVQKVQAKKPAGGPVEAARKQLPALKAFIQQKDLVTIPGPEEAQVAEAPPYQRWNFAYIEIPGPYEKNLPSVYYISPPNPAWSEAERKSYIPAEARLLFTSVHEVWPGHFLQFLHANRAPSKFGQIFVGYAFAEGWAHYTEELMVEAGLADGDPEKQIGQRLSALLRNVRFLSAIGLHTGKMAVEQSEKMFREQGFTDPGTAREQSARGTFDPAYLNYTLGKLMIRKLREDWSASRGGRQAWKQFNDEFLTYGGPPVPLVRKAMMGGEQGSLF
ncbi:MAG: DUF885 domain-containing protein [Acidobacteriales bacterium]|nr:DUF885 domain-containing protein [Terriglobales bacterium]